MIRENLERVLAQAASERDCRLVELKFNDDDNVFEVTIDKLETGTPVDLQDCEYVHRAVLKAFDRDIEDYALTVSSLGISAEEADRMLNSTEQ